MNFSYNLVNQPWIPCLFDDGTLCELGLRAVLKEAPRIREIAHDSPLFVASIHPILTVILHRVLGGQRARERDTAWKTWCQQGHFDSDAIDAYFQQWSDRFDLFHSQFPFYQVAALEMSEASSLFRLAMEENNAPAMFANRASPEWDAPSPALAAQLLVTIQNFALGFGRSSKCKIAGQEIEPPYSADGPLLRGLTVWPSGETLFQSLCLGVVPHELNSQDAPCWELDAPHELRDVATKEARQSIAPRGICDLLTLQSRLIRLLPTELDGTTVVPGAYFTQGRSLEKDEAGRPAFHPLKLYFTSKNAGIVALSLSEGKAIWRNAHTLFSSQARGQHAQNPLAFVAKLTAATKFRPNLNVVGMATEPGKAGKFLMWRFDRLPFSPALLTDNDLVETLETANKDADLVADEMRARFATVVRIYIAGDKDGGHKPDPDDVKALVGKFDPRRDYWPRLETHFYDLLSALTQKPDEVKKATEQWHHDLQSAARECLKTSCHALGTSPKAISAVSQIDLSWGFNLNYLRNPKDYLAEKKLRETALKAASKKAVPTSDSASQRTLDL